jgi:hypothetical protein
MWWFFMVQSFLRLSRCASLWKFKLHHYLEPRSIGLHEARGKMVAHVVFHPPEKAAVQSDTISRDLRQ